MAQAAVPPRSAIIASQIRCYLVFRRLRKTAGVSRLSVDKGSTLRNLRTLALHRTLPLHSSGEAKDNRENDSQTAI